MSETLELTTKHQEVSELVEELAGSVDDTSIQLVAERRFNDGDWVRFDVRLADGSSVLEGVGRCSGSELVGGETHRVRLSLLQFDMRNEIMFERIVLAKEAIEGGESTGQIDLSEMGAELLERSEPKTSPPPPPPKGRPPVTPGPKPPIPSAAAKSKGPPAASELPPKPPLAEEKTSVGPPSSAPSKAPPPLPLKKPAPPDDDAVHRAQTSVAAPLDEEKTSVAPPPTKRERAGESAKPNEPRAAASPAKPVTPRGPTKPPPPPSKPTPANAAPPTPPPSKPTPPKPPPSKPAPSKAEPSKPAPPKAERSPTAASKASPAPAAKPAAPGPDADEDDGDRKTNPEPVPTPSENTAPQEIATLDTVVSRVAEPRTPSGDGLRLHVPVRLVDRARALAPTLPAGVADSPSVRGTPEESVLYAALRLGLASLAAIADADDDEL